MTKILYVTTGGVEPDPLCLLEMEDGYCTKIHKVADDAEAPDIYNHLVGQFDQQMGGTYTMMVTVPDDYDKVEMP